MRPFDRRPTDAQKSRWQGLESTKNAKKAIDDLLANGGKKPEELVSTDFTSAWRDDTWKEALKTSQDGLCFWCTVNPKKGNSSGQVDHIRPKTDVYRHVILKKRHNGQEDREKLPTGGLRPGYYWLAYDPDNLVFCCQKCNNNKTSLWPVNLWEEPADWKAPQQGVQETAPVLNPFDPQFNPFDHFQFDEFGGMHEVPGDERARATILLVGLDRPPYTDGRKDILRDLKTDLGALFKGGNPGPTDVDLMRRIADNCQWSSPHAAFYRVALRKLLHDRQCTWKRFKSLLGQSGVSLDILEPPHESWRE